MDQFVDVCILAGCDYCEGIKGIAATTAHKLVKAQGSLAKGVASLDKEKHPVPSGVDYEEVRALFTAPDVTDPESLELKWSDPDEAAILQFMVTEKGFKQERMESGIAKLKKFRKGGEQVRRGGSLSPLSLPGTAPCRLLNLSSTPHFSRRCAWRASSQRPPRPSQRAPAAAVAAVAVAEAAPRGRQRRRQRPPRRASPVASSRRGASEAGAWTLDCQWPARRP